MALYLIIAGLVLWMLACAYCGFRWWILGFATLLVLALAGNLTWMVAGLQADPLSPHAIMAHAAAVMYATSSFVFGWIIARFVRGWRESRIND